MRDAFRTVSSLVLFTLLLAAAPRALAQETDGGSVRIPWHEFEKLLQPDSEEIVLSWEEFRKILAQTGREASPQTRVDGGRVVLTRAQFSKLLAAMKPTTTDSQPAPPAEFLITKSSYRGVVGEASVSFRSDLDVEVFSREVERYVKIPLYPQSLAIERILIDGEPALTILENGHHTLTTRSVGRHTVTVQFSIQTPAQRNRQELTVAIPRTPVTELALEFAMPDIEVEVAGGQRSDIRRVDERTLLKAVLAPTSSLQFRWRKQLPEVIKGPAKIYAETMSHLVIEDDALRVHSEINLDVLQNTIPSLTLSIPAGCSVLDVRGEGVGDWREIPREGTAFLDISFEYPRSGTFGVTVVAEKLLAEASTASRFEGFQVVDAIRDKGHVGVELDGAAEITLADSAGLVALDVSELPPALVGRARKPLLFGFKYLHHPYSLVLDITSHDQLPVISTVVDSANGVTLFTEDGKLVHRVLYTVRNTSKQFLELQIPEKAQVWSVFVAQESVRPRIDGSTILIPLNRSPQGATGLVAFDVEIVYFEKSERFSSWGSRSAAFPVPDVIISQMMWSVYLPVGYSYFGFNGTVEAEESARGLRPLLAANREVINTATATDPVSQSESQVIDEQRRRADALSKRFSSNLAIDQEQLVQQLTNEAQFGQRVQQLQTDQPTSVPGTPPIRVRIPTSGQVYRFAKTIVNDEPLTLSLGYVSPIAINALQGVLLLSAVSLLWALRRRIIRLASATVRRLPTGAGPIVLFIVSIACWPLSAILAVAGIAGSVAWLAVRRHRRRQLELDA